MSKHYSPTLFAFAGMIFVEQICRVLQGNIDILIIGIR